jgi:hypothetical protein
LSGADHSWFKRRSTGEKMTVTVVVVVVVMLRGPEEPRHIPFIIRL